MSIRRFGGALPGFKASARIDTMEVTLDTNDAHTNSYDTIEYNVINWDTGNWYDDTNYNWTPTHSGLYLHNFNGRWVSNETWYLTFHDVTGAVDLMNRQRLGATTAGIGMWWSWQWWLEGGNAYDIRAYTTTTSSINSATPSDCRMQVVGPIAT